MRKTDCPTQEYRNSNRRKGIGVARALFSRVLDILAVDADVCFGITQNVAANGKDIIFICNDENIQKTSCLSVKDYARQSRCCLNNNVSVNARLRERFTGESNGNRFLRKLFTCGRIYRIRVRRKSRDGMLRIIIGKRSCTDSTAADI